MTEKRSDPPKVTRRVSSMLSTTDTLASLTLNWTTRDARVLSLKGSNCFHCLTLPGSELTILLTVGSAQSRSPTAINVHPFRMKSFGCGLSCVSAVKKLEPYLYRRDAENAEEAQRFSKRRHQCTENYFIIAINRTGPSIPDGNG